MRLDFNILWVEDQPDNVKAQRDRIDYLIRKEGFRLQVEFASSVDGAKEFLASDIFGDHIDLILMDYDLGTAPMGDEGLLAVRNVFRYKDIVFYSARASDLLAIVAKKRVQGVFCSPRGRLPDTVNGVFQALVKKILDIDHSRGIIMGASSDIDNMVNDCLLIACDQGNGELQENARKIIATRLLEIRKRFEKDATSLGSLTRIDKLFELHNLYTSVDRLNLLRKTLQGGEYGKECAAMKIYAQKTMPKRNVLAHVRVRRDGFSRKLIDKDGNELTSDEMRSLRYAMLEYQEIFEKLIAVLKAA